MSGKKAIPDRVDRLARNPDEQLMLQRLMAEGIALMPRCGAASCGKRY